MHWIFNPHSRIAGSSACWLCTATAREEFCNFIWMSYHGGVLKLYYSLNSESGTFMEEIDQTGKADEQLNLFEGTGLH